MEYRELLKKYIRQVIICEGVTFIPTSEDTSIEMTQEDIDELNKLAEESLGGTA